MIKKILSNKRGETLVESAVSLLIFVMIISVVTLVLFAALRITQDSIRRNLAVQETINRITVDEFDHPDDNFTSTTILGGNITFHDSNGPSTANFTQPVTFHADPNGVFFVFRP